MILLCGIPSEPPLAMVSSALSMLNIPIVTFNQRQFASMQLRFSIEGSQITGWLEFDGAGYRLEDFRGVYVRLMDDRFLPELQNETPDSPMYVYCRNLHETLVRWAEITPARVVNRAGAMSSNNSKPFQAQLIRRQGFEVPDTLITNEPELALEFRRRHKRTVYKSISGVRSIVQTFEDKDVERLDLIRWCPAQFQEFIEGDNVRVHVVGSRVFATLITSTATDYRYAQSQIGEPAKLEVFDLSDEIAEKCVNLAKALSLAFAGIDLKITPDNRYYCFEVNPSPGFSYYEANTGQPIAQAVARYLVIGDE